MVHSGYEPSAVAQTFGSLKGFLRTAKVSLFGFGPSETVVSPRVEVGSEPESKTDAELVQLQEYLPMAGDAADSISETQSDEAVIELSTRS